LLPHRFSTGPEWFIAPGVVLLMGMILALVKFYDVIYKE